MVPRAIVPAAIATPVALSLGGGPFYPLPHYGTTTGAEKFNLSAGVEGTVLSIRLVLPAVRLPPELRRNAF
jgi:hypothetical protein